MGSAAVQVRAVHEIADADHSTDAVVRETLQVIDEILAGEIFLRHRAVEIVLISDVTVEIDLVGNDCLSG
jgi:hypothetical protein